MEKTIPTLKSWTVQKFESKSVEGQPEIIVLWGHIWDDEKQRFRDGKQVRTSQVLELNVKEGFAQTLNTRYELGDPSKSFVEILAEKKMTPESLSQTWKSIY